MDTRRRTFVAAGTLAAALAAGAIGGTIAGATPAAEADTPTTVPAGFRLGGDSATGWHEGRRLGLGQLQVCAQRVWSAQGPERATDRLGAELSGGETSVERTVAVYATVRSARRALSGIASPVRACAAQSAALSPAPFTRGPRSVSYVDRPRRSPRPGPGFAVVVTRVGTALLLERDYLQSTDAATVRAAFARIPQDTAAVLEQMEVFDPTR